MYIDASDFRFSSYKFIWISQVQKNSSKTLLDLIYAMWCFSKFGWFNVLFIDKWVRNRKSIFYFTYLDLRSGLTYYNLKIIPNSSKLWVHLVIWSHPNLTTPYLFMNCITKSVSCNSCRHHVKRTQLFWFINLTAIHT